jgi:HSP20 family protein
MKNPVSNRSKEDFVMGSLTRWNDVESALDLMNELRRQFALVFDDGREPAVWAAPRVEGYAGWPRTTWTDHGDTFELTADVPGMTEKDVTVSIDQGLLSIKGERKEHLPEGKGAHGETSITCARSFSLPAEVDAEKATATVKNGVLTVILPKAEALKPRQITVTAG